MAGCGGVPSWSAVGVVPTGAGTVATEWQAVMPGHGAPGMEGQE